MKEFTKLNNGYELKVILNEEALLSKIEELKSDEDYLSTTSAVNRYDEEVSEEDILKDLAEFEDEINKASNAESEEIFKGMALKKNGTFKRNCKHTVKEAINGSYWEDSYGWNTLVLRIVPDSDTVAHFEFDNIVIHY